MKNKNLLIITILITFGSFRVIGYESQLPYCTGNYSGEWNFCQGEYKTSDGSVYKGEFRKGMLNGIGTWEKDGDFYEGDFVNWARHGKGIYQFSSGAIYVGDLERGFFH